MGAMLIALRLHRRLHAVWSAPPGWRGVLVSVNHTDIGRRFIVASFFFFAVGGVLAMLIRAQLSTPHSAFVGPEIYNQLFTMHGTLMMFLFAIPLIEGLALYMLPKLLGARDLAFPRLSAFGFWCYAFGGSILLLSLLLGLAPDSGWFMYTPLSSRTYTPGINADFWLIGVTFVEVSAICAAVEIMVTVLKVRAPGMSLDKMPILAWYLMVTALMMLVGFPPLILGSILLEVERAFNWPFFEPARGGDPLLWQHLFWLFGHPEVYIIFIPAAGVISTVLPVMARTKLFGYGWIVAAIFALAFLSFGLWVHHMFTVGIPHMALGFFSAASALVAVPTGVQIFAWLATLWSGRPELKLPMLYLIGFFFVFVLGGLTGVMLAMVPFNWQAHDTHFVVAHLHYVLVGGFVFPLLAGAYYWLPHFTGNRVSLKLGEAAFWLIFIGFNATFFLMHLTGLLGMPRRVDTYPADAGWTWLNLLSSVGSFVLAFGFALFLIDVVVQCFHGRKSPRNPWGGGTLEWAMPLPPPAYNFASLPQIAQRDPLPALDEERLRLARGEGYLGRARGNLRETLGVEAVSGRLEQLIVLPGNSWLPLATALATGAFFVAVLVKLYWVAPVAAALVALLACCWAWGLGERTDRGPVDVGCGQAALPHREAADAPGHWGSIFTLIADATLFVSLLFGYAYLWTIAPNWPPPALIEARWGTLALGAAGFAVAAWAAWRSLKVLRAGERPAVAVGGAAAATVAGATALSLTLMTLPAPTSHAYAAAGSMLVWYALVHAGIALVMLAYVWARIRAGYASAVRSLELRVAVQWTFYAAAAGALTLALLQVPELLGVGR
jgi:cytochrome c oxidase subunit I+III